jgi:asparagine synthase (glutamine-hydrolysing)
MCGITGLISFDPLTERERAIVSKMNEALVHRGPDSQGVVNDKHVALAMRRLSIIDVAGGQQPLCNETGTVSVVCNGEIYNYLELREELVKKGHRLSSKTDVEVIAHLYEDMGLEFLSALRGMFSIALWDAEKKRLVLARDRMGEKPLYWYKGPGGRLWFSSEMKSLLQGIREYQPPLSLLAVQLFLTYQYIPEPHTMFEGVRKLPAGHFLSVSVDQLDSQPQPYWHYLSVPEKGGDPVPLVREELDTACRIMGRSDVPVGVALSGGIDSAVVAALSARSYPGTLQAFSVGYRGRPSMDERGRAAEVADYLKIPFYDVELAEDDFVRSFPMLVWEMDDPIADIAGYGYYAVSALAREHGVPVLLSGLGGDELFWGYSWVRDAVRVNERRKKFQIFPRWLQRVLMPNIQVDDALTFYDLHRDLRIAEACSRKIMSASRTSELAPDLLSQYSKPAQWDHIDLRLSHVLNQTWLISNCLALADRMSMAHSVEMRLPLLDIRLVELVVGLRKNGLKDWRQPHKWLLIEAVKDLVPTSVLSRPKQGFTPPVMEWYEAIRRHYGHLVLRGTLVQRGIFQRHMIENMIANGEAGFVYKLILLEIWCRLFVDRLDGEHACALIVEQGALCGRR